jgi:hypothetical protein
MSSLNEGIERPLFKNRMDAAGGWRPSSFPMPVDPISWCWRCRVGECPSATRRSGRPLMRSSSGKFGVPGHPELAMGAVPTGGSGSSEAAE